MMVCAIEHRFILLVDAPQNGNNNRFGSYRIVSYRIVRYSKYKCVGIKDCAQTRQILVLPAPLELACAEGEHRSGYQVMLTHAREKIRAILSQVVCCFVCEVQAYKENSKPVMFTVLCGD